MIKIELSDGVFKGYRVGLWEILPNHPPESLFWRLPDGKVYTHLGNEGDRLPDNTFVTPDTEISRLQEEVGGFVNVIYGPAIRVQRNADGQIRRSDFLSKERRGLWAQVVETENGWMVRRIE